MTMKDVSSILICLSLVFLSHTHGFLPGVEDTNNADVCPYTDVNDREVEGSRSWRVFNQLTANETQQVYDFMFQEMGYYNPNDEGLPPTTAGPNFIYRVELMEPVKDEVLNYLDGEGPEPQRYAFVIAIRPLSQPKDVMEYKIGPIPITPGAQKDPSQIGLNGDDSPREGVIAQKLKADGEIPFSKRPAEVVSAGWTETVINNEAYKLKKIFKETSGWCYGVNTSTFESIDESLNECGVSLVTWLSFPAIDLDSTKRIMHIVWFFNPRNGGGDERNLHSIPISFKLDEEDTDEENWNTFDYEYCHQGPFSSAEELLEAYENGTLVKCVAEDWKDFNYDEGWSRTDNRDTPRPGSEKAGPRTFYPDGPRFSADTAERGTGFYFNYMGWEGHVSLRYASGITLHDLRFRERRIVYELSLQEQFVAYGGFSGAGQTVFMDSYYGIGLTSQSLRKGVDCPEVARYFPMSKFHISGYHDMTEDAVCIFEEDSQTPEWRHTHANGTENKAHADGVRRSTLVIRTVATVGNYDYLYSIRFKPDASISVETTLAGYMLTSFFDVDGQTDRDIAFGTRVGKHTLALLHDHLSGWKVDLDVLGTENSVRRMSVKIGTWEEAMRDVANDKKAPPPWHRSPVVKYVHTETIENEFGFHNHDPGAIVHSFINEQETNAWGYPRGYSIMHGLTARQLLPDTHPFTKAASWTKYHLAVTQRKERELMSHGAIYDMTSPGDPVISLDHYLDNESIRQTDLVAWVMMGLLHIPRSEDVPLISNFASEFYIKPWNYYNELVSMDLGNKEDFSSCRPSVGRSFDYSWGS